MIFVTIGTQASFDRLVKAMDQVGTILKDEKIIIQALSTTYQVQSPNIKLLDFIPQNEFDKYYDEADLIVSHAGTGSIFSALTSNKSIIVLPRKASLGEHRNEHQMATAEKFYDLGLLEVAFDEKSLIDKVTGFMRNALILNQRKIGQFASYEFLSKIKKEFI